MNRLVVVGGGVLGTLHAVDGLARGWEVTHLERELEPRGASVRNFGLIWVSGRAPGRELDLALRARQKWEEVSASHPGTGFRANGSLTVVRTPEELAVLQQVVDRDDAGIRCFSLVEPDEAQRLNPALASGRGMVAALHCAADAVVEPRQVLGALRRGCQASDRYRWLPGREVVDVRDHQVVDGLGDRHRGDLVILCPGAAQGGVVGEVLQGAPLQRVRLQMIETGPSPTEVTTSLADGDSLRYYPGYAVPARTHLPSQDPIAEAWAAQLLLAPRLDGSLTIGDTHSYQEPFPFDTDEAPSEYLLSVTAQLLEGPVPPVVRRWAGVYSQTTEAGGDHPYFRSNVAAGVQVVTGPGGRGMTLAPAIAEETFA